METDLSVVMRHMRQPPAHFPTLFEDLEIRYFELPVENAVSGWLQHVGREFTVLVNRNETEQRKRMISAHALAAFLLYRDKFHTSRGCSRYAFNLWGDLPTALAEYSPLRTDAERLCNRLAIQMLMPAATIRKLWRGLSEDEVPVKVDVLAARFAVSPAVMRVRAQTLNLIEPAAVMPEMPSLAPAEPVLA